VPKESRVTDPLPELKKHLLERLNNAKGQQLSAKAFTPYKRVRDRLSADDSLVRTAQEQLVQQSYVIHENRTYRLAPEGMAYLKSLDGAPPETNPKLFPYQQSFVLLKIFLAKDRTLTLAGLTEALRTKEIVSCLNFGSVSPDSNAKARPVMNAQLIRWVLETLVNRGALDLQRAPNTVRYSITEDGEDLLSSSGQYPGIPFKLTGKELSNLIDAVRRSVAKLAPPASTAPEQRPTITPASERDPATQPLTSQAMLSEFDELRRGAHIRNGLVPICDLRQRIAAKYGANAALHETFDPLLMRLDREDRLRLVSIGDRSRVLPEQLNDSIPGENETFFFVEVAHEHATV
jgi:hypothetical protein